MSTGDKLSQLLISTGMLYFTGVISGPLAVGLAMLAAAFLLISRRRFCPADLLFNINTNKKEK